MSTLLNVLGKFHEVKLSTRRGTSDGVGQDRTIRNRMEQNGTEQNEIGQEGHDRPRRDVMGYTE